MYFIFNNIFVCFSTQEYDFTFSATKALGIYGIFSNIINVLLNKIMASGFEVIILYPLCLKNVKQILG